MFTDLQNIHRFKHADKIMRVKVKEQVEKRLDCQEHFIARFLAETGYKIEDCELVEVREPFLTRWFMRRRADAPDP